jgi:hypothetical protein
MRRRLAVVSVVVAAVLSGCSLFSVDVKSEEHKESKVEKDKDHSRSN